MKTQSPNRLRESSSSEVERLLLQAGRARAPLGAKRRAMAAATGVVAASALTAGTAGGAVAGKTSAGLATLLSVKWVVVVGVASVSVAAATATVHVVRAERAETRATEVAPPRPRVSEATRPSREATRQSGAGDAPAAVAAVPMAATATTRLVPAMAPDLPAPRASAPSSKSSPGASSSAAAELAMLDQARGAIRIGEPAEALSILDAYRARFPRGAMGPEASILRVEALVRAGDRAGAEREGESFRRANPNSPYSARIDSLLARSSENPSMSIP